MQMFLKIISVCDKSKLNVRSSVAHETKNLCCVKMDFTDHLLTSKGNNINILANIPPFIAYTVLVDLTERDLIQVRRACPHWKSLLDRDEFWEMKILKENLNANCVARSSNIEEFVSYFKSRHHGIFRYFNRLKWNWEGKWFQEVKLHPDIREVFHMDEEALIYKQPDVGNPGIKIADPATGQVIQRVLLKEMESVVKIKKSGSYIVFETNSHKLKAFNGNNNTLLSELQESSRLTHLKMFQNIIVYRTVKDCMFRVWDATSGKAECKFYDASDNVDVDFEKYWIATDNTGDRRIRVWKLTDGELLHATRCHSSAIKQILIRDKILIVVECSGQISAKNWLQGNVVEKEKFFYGRPNSKIRRLDGARFAYIESDQVFHIQSTDLTGDCLQSIRITENRIQKIKSNSQFIFALCENGMNLYDKNKYGFVQKIDFPFQANTLVCKLTESKLLFQKRNSTNISDQFCLYNFSPRSLGQSIE